MLSKMIDVILKRSGLFKLIVSRMSANEKQLEKLTSSLDVKFAAIEHKLVDIEHSIQAKHNELNSIAVAEAVYHLNARLSLLEAQNTRETDTRLDAASTTLPVHFFTIVLNGEPFIRYHEQMLTKLPVRWHWHIIEGVAAHKHDSSWMLQLGGEIPLHLHKMGLSVDGTSEYLDDLKKRFPQDITIYRKQSGEFWDGKREMVNAPLASITEECLLWEIDSDELWTAAQIAAVHRAFMNNPRRTAAFYWAWFFVGPDKILLTRNNYANNPRQEWLRTWRFQPGDFWASHSPPILARKGGEDSSPMDIARIAPFQHFETEAMGAVFQHYAYATEEQLAFKEIYYGYKDALARWKELQQHNGRGMLRDYFSWVSDDAAFDSANNMSVGPIAQRDRANGTWKFSSSK